MSYTLVTLFSFSIFIAAFIGLVKFKHISSENYPFIICTWIGSANEVVSLLMSRVHGSTAINNNIYMLAEALLITWQFSRWGILGSNKKLFTFLICSIAGSWMLEYLLVDKANNLFYFSILYCMLVVLLAIEANVKIIITYQGQLLKNHRFIICCGFMIYFTFRILIEAFWLTGLNASSSFRNEVYLAMTWINLFVNILFCIAFLWIPRKPQFISI